MDLCAECNFELNNIIILYFSAWTFYVFYLTGIVCGNMYSSVHFIWSLKCHYNIRSSIKSKSKNKNNRKH